MTRRQQLLEEAGRLRRLVRACRGDIAWAFITRRVPTEEIARRVGEVNGWLGRAVELEREAATPTPHAPMPTNDLRPE